MDILRRPTDKIATVHRRLAWPLRGGDKQHIVLISHVVASCRFMLIRRTIRSHDTLWLYLLSCACMPCSICVLFVFVLAARARKAAVTPLPVKREHASLTESSTAVALVSASRYIVRRFAPLSTFVQPFLSWASEALLSGCSVFARSIEE